MSATAKDVVTADKRALRRELRRLMNALPGRAFTDAGAAVAAALTAKVSSMSSSMSSSMCSSMSLTVAMFASRDDEIDVRPIEQLMRRCGHAVAVPRIDGDALVFHVVDDIHALPRDRFMIPTPPSSLPSIALSSCALVLVPGLGFDVAGGRLGYGRGFYDRALADVDLDVAVGILLDDQWVPRVPMTAADIRLRWLCSPARGLVGAVDNVDP